MGISPWNVIGGGRLRSDAEEKRREESGEAGRTMMNKEWRRTETEKKVANALEQVSTELGGQYSVSAGKTNVFMISISKALTTFYVVVAIAYVMHKAPYVFPLVGGRKVEHLHDNIKALSISLSEKQMEFLESQVDIDPGFPHTLLVSSRLDVASLLVLIRVNSRVTDLGQVNQFIARL